MRKDPVEETTKKEPLDVRLTFDINETTSARINALSLKRIAAAGGKSIPQSDTLRVIVAAGLDALDARDAAAAKPTKKGGA